MSISICNKLYDINSTVLNIMGQRLTQLPEEIEYLENLKELNLAYNNFKGPLPMELCKFYHLSKLLYYFNQITVLPPEIGLLSKLTHLDFYGNQITNLPPEIGNLVTLKILYIPHNKLTYLPVEIGQLVNLEIFHIHSNQLTTLPTEIGQLLRIKELLLHANQLTWLPIEIGQLVYIEKISVYNNPLENLFNPIIQRILTRQKHQKSIYEDDQNIHNSSIQKSVKESMFKLLNNYPLNIMSSEYLEWKELDTEIKQRLTEYINSAEIHTLLNVTFSDVFYAVVYEIHNLPIEYHSNIKIRLNEEMIESNCKCFTGRISRLVNCLSGFSDKININLSESEEISNVISVMQIKYFHDITEMKEQIKKELLNRGYKQSLINEWLVHIDTY